MQLQKIIVHGQFKNIGPLCWKKKSQMLFRMSGITQMTFNGKKMNVSNIVKDKNTAW